MTIGSKVRQIRESEKLTRKDFEEKTGMWLTIDEIDPDAGQISPYI